MGTNNNNSLFPQFCKQLILSFVLYNFHLEEYSAGLLKYNFYMFLYLKMVLIHAFARYFQVERPSENTYNLLQNINLSKLDNLHHVISTCTL